MKTKTKKVKEIIDLVAEAAEAKQAVNIRIFDVAKTSSLVDYFLICSAESEPQLRAIEKEIDRRLRAAGITGRRWEGVAKSGWLILDLGAIIIHVMGLAERAYYNLEELWEKEAIIYHY